MTAFKDLMMRHQTFTAVLEPTLVLLVFGLAGAIGLIARLRGKGGVPPTSGGWRELEAPELRAECETLLLKDFAFPEPRDYEVFRGILHTAEQYAEIW